eukprot:GHUV01013214.1.p1 GENE.GHUV01013214.1~~GHUV01013214.1.p1  ORF type:complete len:740 (+),score=291.18 GHUV01013214.1:937-3156(+)
MSPRSMETLVHHSTGISPPTSPQRASVQFHLPSTAKPGLLSRTSIQAAANTGAGLFSAVLPAGISANSNGLQQRSGSLNSPTHGSPKAAAAARAPAISANAVALAATVPSSMQNHGHPGGLLGGSAPRTRPGEVWKIAYAFSTPVEKKLQKELETLKADPGARKALEARIEAYKAAEAPLIAAREALLEDNKQQAAMLTRGVKMQQVQATAKQRDERLQQARQQHKEQEEEQYAAKLAAAQRSDRIKQQRIEYEAAREAEQRRLWQAKQWAGVICSTTYATQLLAAIRQMEQAKIRAGQQQAAVVTIQRFWRGYRARKQYKHARHCVCLLQQGWRRYLSSTAQHDTRRYKAAMCLLHFLEEFNSNNSGQLKWAAKRVKHTVLRDLRLAKELDLQRTAQLALLTQQWTALEQKMIALARRRAGADQVDQGSGPKTTRQSNLVQLTKQKTTMKSMSRRTTAADMEDGQPMTAVNTNAAVPDGPAPSSCRASDRLLLEDLSPTPLELKSRIAQVYLKMKAKAYMAVLGLYWRDKAAWKRSQRDNSNLAAAKAILQGPSDSQQPGGGQPGPPQRPRFRATATLRELGVLMQQSVAEAPYIEAAKTRAHADNYRLQLEQELAARKLQAASADAATAAAPSDSNAASSPDNSSGQRQETFITEVSPDKGPGLKVERPGAKGAQNDAQQAAAAAAAKWSKERLQACLLRRFALAGCNLVQGLSSIPATHPDEWDDVTLSELLYSGA